MRTIDPGLAIRIFDYSENPRELLREISEPLLRLKDAQQLPVVHVRRGWLHGSHLHLVLRPYGERAVDAEEFVATAAALAAARDAHTPEQETYLRRAGELARWENVRDELLPHHPQGTVTTEPHRPRADSLALSRAVDQIMGRFLEPVLGSLTVPEADLLPHLAQVLALLARTHPRGISAGALPYRSHAEGVASATGKHTDLTTAFAARYAKDRPVFLDALQAPVHGDTLRAWERAMQYAWGVAEAHTAGQAVDDRVLQNASGGDWEHPLGTPVRSDFIGELLDGGLMRSPSYRHIAHRIVLNVLYTSLTCFGITPMQRYYLCYGLGEGTDEVTGTSSIERVRAFSRELA
ncbi:hypothetical protein [Kitasatospora phosalacinea]|uniref:Thiopeptide-type bacteriocin biosynthesis domain-containing protein n=1 Tax=Kitasatospora phosalacinea TaxID=2065 RepID=A0ABW6GG56_9ACTN